MIIKQTIFFEPANEDRNLHIYLPDDYEYTNERYPVMYFFDGHNLFFDHDATYGKSWGLKEFLEQWEKPMIIVGIECSHKGNHRLIEYCPYNISSNFLGDIDGTGDETIRWMIEILKPMIDQNFRTYSFREATAIGGSSMGGLMSLFAVTKYNQYFSKAACLSSAITVCVSDLLADMEKYSLDADSKVYLSWGEVEAGATEGNPEYDTDMAKSNRKMEQKLNEKGCQTRIFFQPGGRHCEADWEKQIPRFMNYLWLNQ
ncbi:MAG: alpha/beta hydrolase-fold protein [Lachnospiraceae bacterium]|nr:alpha/beta hydrolase-fold protein [Lachnospiraceae bacterium]